MDVRQIKPGTQMHLKWLAANGIVYNAYKNNSWADLDLSSVVGAHRCLVLLKIDKAALYAVQARTNGDTADFTRGISISSAGAIDDYLLVLTDANGVIEWFTQAGIGQATTVTIIGYAFCLYSGAQVYSDNPSNTWTDVDLGVGQCLALLKVVAGGNTEIRARPDGETLFGAAATGCSQAQGLTNGKACYIIVPTDSLGIIEVIGQQSLVITLEGYVVDAVWESTQIANGDSSLAWSDVQISGKGAGLALIKATTTDNVGGVNGILRRNGDSVSSSVIGNFGLAPVGAGEQTAYALVMTDANGKFEEISTIGAANRIYTLLTFIPDP